MTLWAFDIETADWDRFVVGCAIANDGRRHVFRDELSVASWYASTDAHDVILCHNGGRFDMLFLLDACRCYDPKWHATISGSTIITLQARGNAEVRDTFRLFMMSLADWTMSKAEFPLPCKGRCKPDQWIPGQEKCGGYCSIEVGMLEADLLKLIDYCMQDCACLLAQYQSDVQRLEACGLEVRNRNGEIRRTLGGVSWATAERYCGKQSPIDWNEYHLSREGYYGGRTEVFQTRATAGHRWDINSAYPWALTLPVPVGKSRILGYGSDASDAYRRGLPGVYAASVYDRGESMAMLPHRVDGSLLWATGAVQGAWSLHELQEAEQDGLHILSFEWAIVYESEDSIYGPYMEHLYNERRKALASCSFAKADKGELGTFAYEGPMRDWICLGPKMYSYLAPQKERDCKCDGHRWAALLKWYLNSLSGKLAQQGEYGTLLWNPDHETLCKWERDIARAEKKGDRRAPKLDWLGGRAWMRTIQRIPSSARPAQAATLTGRVRTVLRRKLASEPGKLYCDTDSAYFEQRDTETLYEHDGEKEWKPKAKAKGIPKVTRDDVFALDRGETVSKRIGVKGVRSAIRSTNGEQHFVAHEVTRSLQRDRQLAGTRYVQASGVTVPLHRVSVTDASNRPAYCWPGIGVDPLDLLPSLRSTPEPDHHEDHDLLPPEE